MLLKDRRKLIIIGVVAVALIIGAVFFIFSRGKSADDYVKEYYGYLENKEYGDLVESYYDNLMYLSRLVQQKEIYSENNIYTKPYKNDREKSDLFVYIVVIYNVFIA